jgi:hypothetical protein
MFYTFNISVALPTVLDSGSVTVMHSLRNILLVAPNYSMNSVAKTNQKVNQNIGILFSLYQRELLTQGKNEIAEFKKKWLRLKKSAG